MGIFAELADNGPSGCRTVVWCDKPKKLRKREHKVCLRERAILRLLDSEVDCNIDISIRHFHMNAFYNKGDILTIWQQALT